ncbi:anti-sigma factor RshA [Schaalia vaccimaxillae]|uniref:anti-sigma factor RshA n=1 Tax=Schaalia vaccimaxillae TaxID=183916 RepID=UPI0003B687C7|nr:anti-sigma factor RshA [Schaalia vaccimaxillae]
MRSDEPTCQEVQAQIFALVDCQTCDEISDLIDSGQVDGPQARVRELMARHIAHCGHCSDLVHAEQHLRHLLRSCYEVEVPATVRATIVQRISEVSVTVRSSRS